MSGELFYGVNQFLIFIGLLVILLSSVWVGYWVGSRSKERKEKEKLISTLEASVLGLLALLLGFTFAMAATRYEVRKELVIDQTNAIRVAYLRLRLLPKEMHPEMVGLFKRYVDVQVELYTAGYNPEQLQALDDETRMIQRDIWNKAYPVAYGYPDANTYPIVLEAINDMISAHAKWQMVMGNHVPEVILILLVLVSAIALILTGFTHGINRYPNLLPTVLLAFLFTMVILVIVDLDRPRRGLIRESQDSLVYLKQRINEYKWD